MRAPASNATRTVVARVPGIAIRWTGSPFGAVLELISAMPARVSSAVAAPAANRGGSTIRAMCRNIRTLHNFEPSATPEEVRAAALQYVRKVSGSTKPSKANAEVFERAVDEIAHITAHLLEDLVAVAPPKDREVEAAKARARAAKRFAAA